VTDETVASASGSESLFDVNNPKKTAYASARALSHSDRRFRATCRCLHRHSRDRRRDK
jgi:hypothetical protein